MPLPVIINTTGLILRLGEMNESDVLIEAFSPDYGRISLLAKGGKRSKKRFFGLILDAQVLEMNLRQTARGNELWLLESAALIESHAGLRRDYRRFMAAAPVLELLLRGTGAWDPQPAAYDLALLTLARICAAQAQAEMGSALLIYCARLLAELGYGLELGACVQCGLVLDEVASPRLSLAGGLVCTGHGQGKPEAELPLGLIKGLARAVALEPDQLARLRFPPAQSRPGLRFLTRFWQETLGHDLLSLTSVINLLRAA